MFRVAICSFRLPQRPRLPGCRRWLSPRRRRLPPRGTSATSIRATRRGRRNGRRCSSCIPRLSAQKGTLGRSAASMREALVAQSDINKRTSRLYTYASLKADEDLRVAPNQERKQQAQDVFTAFGEATAWIEPGNRARRPAEDRTRSSPPSRGSKQVRVRPRATSCAARRTRLSTNEERCSPSAGSAARRAAATFATSSPRPTFRGRR